MLVRVWLRLFTRKLISEAVHDLTVSLCEEAWLVGCNEHTRTRVPFLGMTLALGANMISCVISIYYSPTKYCEFSRSILNAKRLLLVTMATTCGFVTVVQPSAR